MDASYYIHWAGNLHIWQGKLTENGRKHQQRPTRKEKERLIHDAWPFAKHWRLNYLWHFVYFHTFTHILSNNMGWKIKYLQPKLNKFKSYVFLYEAWDLRMDCLVSESTPGSLVLQGLRRTPTHLKWVAAWNVYGFIAGTHETVGYEARTVYGFGSLCKERWRGVLGGALTKGRNCLPFQDHPEEGLLCQA